MTKFTVKTRKIEIYPYYPDDTNKKSECWDYFRKLDNECYIAKNKATQCLFGLKYTEDLMKSIANDQESKIKKVKIALEDAKLKYNKNKTPKNKELLTKCNSKLNKVTYEYIEKQWKDILPYSTNNTVYTYLKKNFSHMGSYVYGNISNSVVSKFYTDLPNVISGKSIHPQYKKGCPIPFHNKGIRFQEDLGGEYGIILLGYNFRFRFGMDKSNNKLIVKNIVDGKYNHGDSAIQIRGNRIFLLLSVKFPIKEFELDSDKVVGVDLGMVNPVVVALKDGKDRKYIGEKTFLWDNKSQFYNRRKSIQSSLAITGGGKGRKKKLQGLERLRNKERNFTRTYNHGLSKNVIEFALKHNAGTINLEDLSSLKFKSDYMSKLVLRNWTYHELQTMIEQKAKENGIVVKKVPSSYTSQICSCCGHYEEGQRLDRDKFQCKNPNCSNKDSSGKNKIVNADYNSAKNIASGNYIKLD